jgi:hypothetical protein
VSVFSKACHSFLDAVCMTDAFFMLSINPVMILAKEYDKINVITSELFINKNVIVIPIIVKVINMIFVKNGFTCLLFRNLNVKVQINKVGKEKISEKSTIAKYASRRPRTSQEMGWKSNS